MSTKKCFSSISVQLNELIQEKKALLKMSQDDFSKIKGKLEQVINHVSCIYLCL
jgi:hypothetical protein